MASRRKLLVTGFGAFHGVDENPTAVMVRHLAQSEELQNVAFEVLEVSVKCCDEYVHRQLQTLSRDGQQHEEIFFVHLGVNSSVNQINLEQCAYNNMNFRVPDVEGFQPSATPILSSIDLDEPRRTFALEPLLNRLCAACPDAAVNTTLSTDPGRYLCNYVFYRTLTLGERPFVSVYGLQHEPLCGLAVSSLFVHVPPVTVLDMPMQLRVLTALLRELQAGF